MTRASLMLPLVLLTTSLLTGCNDVKSKVEQRVSEEVAEKIIEAAARAEEGGEVDVEIRNNKLEVVDAEGKKTEYQGGEDNVRVTNSEGLDAVASKEIPEDFPLNMPPVNSIENAMRVEQPDGSKVFNVTYEAKSDELAAEAERWQAEFEAKGLSVERKDRTGGGTQMITLSGKGEMLESSAIISIGGDPDRPGVVAVVTWRDTTAVEP